jgi:dephospho-CoA kinase
MPNALWCGVGTMNHRTNGKIVGVTGSMGCGKSYICNLLKKEADMTDINLQYLASDNIRRQILGNDKKYQKIREEIESIALDNVISEEGSIDRLKLSHITYSDKTKLYAIDKLVDTEIEKVVRKKIENYSGITLFESALLVEKNQLQLVDYNVILVDCNNDTQISRLIGGDLPIEQIKKRISLQKSNEEKELEIKMIQELNQGLYLKIENDTITPDISGLLVDIQDCFDIDISYNKNMEAKQ